MHYTFTVEVEVERESGPFASRDELGDQLREAIESADPGQLDGDSGGSYVTSTWAVDEAEPARKR